MAATKPVLYSYFRSSCSWRVRIVLALKNIDYEYRAVNLLTDEQCSEAFTNINPLQEVPVFVENGNVLTHSLPIIEYLEETRPFPALFPTDHALRAKARAVAETIGSGIQPLQNLRILKLLGGKIDDWGKQCIEHGFSRLEMLLQPLHGKCCVQDAITVADVFLVPQVFNATRRFDVDMTMFPVLNDINNHLLSIDAFKSSHPSMQPDCPKELK